jgi:hypothetical protein
MAVSLPYGKRKITPALAYAAANWPVPALVLSHSIAPHNRRYG